MAQDTEPKLPASFETAYKEGHLSDFFALAPGDTASALALPRPFPRGQLVDALRQQAGRQGAPDAVFASLELLAHPESRAVVTGQQTGLLLGPVYTLSKAITAIKLARRLHQEDRPVVPVFWLASQDHDSAEIDHAYLLDMEERLTRLSLPFPAGVPAGRISLKEGWLEQLERELAAFKGPEAHKEEATALLRLGEGKSVAGFFAALLYRLLGQEGLIIIDPLEPEVAPLFKEIYARELQAPLQSSQRINESGERLKGLGYPPQLGRGAGASNVFLEERLDGTLQRELLHAEGHSFYTQERHYTKKELLALLERDPECFTPAAGLRPITQDYLLPTAITVVGPGELKYFAQLREVYELHGVAMPLIWPRASVTLLEPPVKRILEKYELSPAEVQRDFDGVRDRLLLSLHGHGEAIDSSLSEIGVSVARLLEHLAQVDPTMLSAVRRSDACVRGDLERLREKTAAALARQDSITVGQLERLRLHLLPDGVPQERCLSPVSFFMKFGLSYVMARLLTLEPEGAQVLDL